MNSTFGPILAEIVELLTSGITGMATGIGAGLTALVSSIFIDTTGEAPALTVFGGMIVVFAGIALAIGLSRWVTNWVASLGN